MTAGGILLNYPPFVRSQPITAWNAEIYGHILHLSDILLAPDWYKTLKLKQMT